MANGRGDQHHRMPAAYGRNRGSTMRRIATGPLSDRVAELAAKAGQKEARVYVSQSARSQVLNAFALFGAGVVLAAPPVAALTGREVDAIAAHELSHLRRKNYGVWTAFAIVVR